MPYERKRQTKARRAYCRAWTRFHESLQSNFEYTDSFPKAMKVPEAKKAAVTNWKIASLKRIPNTKQTRSNRGGTKKRATQVILVLLWTCVISKFQNLTINSRSTKARRTAWWCSEDDSGSYALFIEQGSSASHMTAAKVLDVISRLPGCAGKASDFLCPHTQVKMTMFEIIKITRSWMPSNLGTYHVLEAHHHGITFQILWHQKKDTCTDTA